MKKSYLELSLDEKKTILSALQEEFEKTKEAGLSLNMARGKPGNEQLDLVSDILLALSPTDSFMDGKVDAKNYGELAGIPSAKKLFADILGCDEKEVFVGGNASLTLMFGLISKAWCFGLKNSEKPWCQEEKVRFLCPAPGYDRHFRITETFGIELITVPMTDEGPDMDKIEELVKDPAVKGIWCVPKYSNPDGIIYSDDTIHRMAALKPAAPDFALIWDNAYCVHEFDGEFVPFEDILTLCREAGNPDMVYEFASTSKITIPGAGVSVMACSEANMKYLSRFMGAEAISYDKVNQLRHVKYLKDREHTLEIMKRHATVMKPKFDLVLDRLEKEIAPLQIANWKKPKGGYFVSLYTYPGAAKRTVALCKEAGLVMTDAGATYPYGKDPQDSNIRIAPSLPSLSELEKAMEIFVLCLKIAVMEVLIG